MWPWKSAKWGDIYMIFTALAQLLRNSTELQLHVENNYLSLHFYEEMWPRKPAESGDIYMIFAVL